MGCRSSEPDPQDASGVHDSQIHLGVIRRLTADCYAHNIPARRVTRVGGLSRVGACGRTGSTGPGPKFKIENRNVPRRAYPRCMSTAWVEYYGGPLDGEMREEPGGLFLVGLPPDDPRGYYMFERLLDEELRAIASRGRRTASPGQGRLASLAPAWTGRSRATCPERDGLAERPATELQPGRMVTKRGKNS